jgi:hypothetical protein
MKKIIKLSVIPFFLVVLLIEIMEPWKLKCGIEKATFHGVEMRFPITMLEAKKEYGLTFWEGVLGREFRRTITQYGNQISESVKVLCHLSDFEWIWRKPTESSILERPANCYSFFFLSIDGDSLRQKLESDFDAKFELQENSIAKKSNTKFTTCYEMKVNDCLYVATSNFGKGKVVTWVTFTYGLDESERHKFRH